MALIRKQFESDGIKIKLILDTDVSICESYSFHMIIRSRTDTYDEVNFFENGFGQQGFSSKTLEKGNPVSGGNPITMHLFVQDFMQIGNVITHDQENDTSEKNEKRTLCLIEVHKESLTVTASEFDKSSFVSPKMTYL